MRDLIRAALVSTDLLFSDASLAAAFQGVPPTQREQHVR